MLGLSANLNYYLFNGNVDLRKGIFRLCESIREEMSLDPSDASNVYMFMSRNRKVVKILHYERGFYVLYEKLEKPRDFDLLAKQDCPLWLQYD